MSQQNNPWLVPDGIEDILPQESEQVEAWRRTLLDEFSRWGYEQVIPPLVEFTQALLSGKAVDLQLDTCQLVDQVSGRMMGVRADLTPQVARIDAHRLQKKTPVRLCYAGEVLRARPNPVTGSRSPIQIGAELFGHAGVQSDIEVIELMLAASEAVGFRQLTLTLGHVGIYRALAEIANFTEQQLVAAHDMLQRKSLPEWYEWLAGLSIQPAVFDWLKALPLLAGDADQVIKQADSLAKTLANVEVDAALARIKAIVKHLHLTHPALVIHLDLSDLRGFDYHTGVVFGLIEPARQRLIAAGGRYDDIGALFGVSRPATGFSMDLRQLMDLALPTASNKRKRILAPAVADLSLVGKIQQLRQEGHRVVIGFPDVDWASQRQQCDHELVQDKGQWVMR